MYSPRLLGPMPNAAFAIICAHLRYLRINMLNTALAIALIAFLSSAWGCRSGPPSDRLLVLGIDGMDPQILRTLMTEGRMPHFEALARRGGFAPLQTSAPPQSPVAWSSFITGLDPQDHGIFDFVHRDPTSLTPFLSTTRRGESGELALQRRGRPFWEILAEQGIPTTIFKVPANFPPSQLAGSFADLPFFCPCDVRTFSGMGTPDMLGTYGTFTYYTEGPYTVPAHLEGGGTSLVAGGELVVPGGKIIGVQLENGWAQLPIHGPTLDEEPVQSHFAIYLDRQHRTAEIVIGQQRLVLQSGEWSPWITIDYGRKPYSLERLQGIARFYLRAAAPSLQLYLTPVNIHPGNPAMPISTPLEASEELHQALGPHYTQGMPDDTKALEADVFDYGEFLRQDALAFEERRRQLAAGVLFFYVHSLDQVCHMLWRAWAPDHPGHRAEFAPYQQAIADQYVAMDDLLGEAVAMLGADADIIVLSDHGFAAYERSFNLNSWLAREGYLALAPQVSLDQAHILNEGHVRWGQTRAYGLGLNALYLNLKGREQHGMVRPEARESLLSELSQNLLDLRDSVDGRQVIKKVYRPGPRADSDLAPDLILGYARGYRASGATAIGQLESAVLQDNFSPWSRRGARRSPEQ
ncbi:MAG: alkaline phosphatase family protein [Candidatus Latescibacteria bacterium]|nr:alkaline phosphatase family protein [Candidatus Latescibacterota bacterium]